MRIAIFENLPPGGALRACYEIGRELISRGHEVEVFRLDMFPDKGAFDLAPEAAALHVVPFRPLAGALDRRVRGGHVAPRSYTLFGPLRRAHEALAAQIRAGRFDVALLHHDALTQSPYALRHLDGVPTVYYCQEPLRVTLEKAILEQHRRRLASSPLPLGWLRLADDGLTLGRLARADLESAQHARVIAVNSVYSRERVWAAYARDAVVCYLGIDATRFVPSVSSSRKRRHEVLSVGLPVSAKGHEMVVEALGRIPAATRPALRLVLPRPDSIERLERLSAERGVTLSVDVGLSEGAFVEHYQCSLATVCAAHLEPFGLTAIESMACGTPVVAIREAGYRETVVDGETGILVEPDPDDMAGAIARLAEEPKLAAAMGERGREEVLRRWTWARTGAQMEAILDQARRN